MKIVINAVENFDFLKIEMTVICIISDFMFNLWLCNWRPAIFLGFFCFLFFVFIL